jgi:aspartate/methionine/tyrosine aminotransferase
MPADNLHLIYGVSKDFGCSGIRIGCVYSSNATIHRCLGSMFFTMASGLAQDILSQALLDERWTSRYISLNEARLRKQYRLVSRRLQQLRVPFLPAQGGFFVWMDVRQWLPPAAASKETTPLERDYELAERLLANGLYLTPGTVFHASEAGWVRLCFAQETSVLVEGIKRLQTTLGLHRPSARL